MNNLILQADENVTKNRHLYVGGSDVPTILGLNKFKTQYELAREKIGLDKNTFKGNEYTQFGNILEPQIRDYINIVNETNFRPQTKIDESRKIRSNTDGYDAQNNLILEVKTHGTRPKRDVYEAQMQLYMDQFECDEGWLALYKRPKNFNTEFDDERLKIEVIRRDKEYVARIYEAIERFWGRCDYLREHPDATEDQFYGLGKNNIQLIANRVGKLEKQLAGFKELEKQYKKAKQELHDAMERHDIKKFETDSVVITRMMPTERKSIDTRKLKKERPDIAAQYEKISKVAGSVRIKFKEVN